MVCEGSIDSRGANWILLPYTTLYDKYYPKSELLTCSFTNVVSFARGLTLMTLVIRSGWTCYKSTNYQHISMYLRTLCAGLLLIYHL